MIIECKHKESLNVIKCKVLIYDSCCNLVLDTWTHNGYISFEPDKKEVYKLIVYPQLGLYPKMYVAHFIYSKYNCNKITIWFSSRLERSITLYLYDANYKGLPIERGEINLWTNHIT